MYNHHIIPRLSWWFTTLDLSLSFVSYLHSLVLPFLKKWCGLPRSANPSILFCGSRSKPGLRLKRIPTVWKQSRAVRLQLLKYSRDRRLQSLYKHGLAREESWSGTRYAPSVELECAEASALPPQVQRQPRAGLGLQHASVMSADSSRSHVAKYIHDVDVAQQLGKLSGLQMQGCWSEWDDLMCADFSWTKLIYGTSDGVLRFLLNSTTNTLPTPDNLRRWGVSRVEPSCPLCHGACTLRHILTGCPVALRQGRYTWRHDSVLSAIRDAIMSSWSTQRVALLGAADLPYIRFVKSGAKCRPFKACPRRHLSDSLLSGALDWSFLFGLEGGLVFPAEITLTALRPDGLIYSDKLKTVILLELTVPIEDCILSARSLKAQRYENLISECQSNGWRASLLSIEIGCRGYINSSFIGLSKVEITSI